MGDACGMRRSLKRQGNPAAGRGPGVVLWAGAGALLLGLSVVIRRGLPADDPLGPLGFVVWEAGWLMMLLAVLPAMGIRPRAFAAGGVVIGVGAALVAAGEYGFRAVGWDFRGQEAGWARLPPFNRVPRVPTGEVFFRRDGPQAWTGAVIRASLELHRRPVPEVYRDEPVIEVRHDRWGFREEEGWEDWEIAVVGDSFTELGTVAWEDLFTTRLARRLGCRVRNLGVSGTGPLTHLHYLRAYGDAPSLRQVVVVFYEGNDLEDMAREEEDLDRFRATGERPDRRIVPQTSLLVGMVEVARGLGRGSLPGIEREPVHRYLSAAGPVPVHLTGVLPRDRRLPEDVVARLERFLGEYGVWARERGVAAWVAYMPSKARVLHGRVEYDRWKPQGREPWWPEELPGLVEAACGRHGVGFVDLTPGLVETSLEHGGLLFNPLEEVHLNAAGSIRVAGLLAEQLEPARELSVDEPKAPEGEVAAGGDGDG